MIEDSVGTRTRILSDVLLASADGSQPLTRDWLLNYELDGVRIPLIDAQGRGIRNVRFWDHTLSITRVESGRYPNRETTPGVWRYPYSIRKNGDLDPSNSKLRNAVRDSVPVLYFYKPLKNTYLFLGTVMPEADHAADREFLVVLQNEDHILGTPASQVERAWAGVLVERRLHQPRFRTIVMAAYEERCAICALPEAALLDAAHIRGDRDPNGQPVVENGLALCAIHHRAYDSKHIGIDEDYRLHVRADILSIKDGPVLDHAIQQLPGSSLQVVPRNRKSRPDPYRLNLTFKEFLGQ